jgi:hypothetical protein
MASSMGKDFVDQYLRRREPALASDILGSLLWPRILQGPVLGARPGRWGLGALAALLVVLILNCPMPWPPFESAGAAASSLWNDSAYLTSTSDRVASLARFVATVRPATFLVAFTLALAALSLVGTAISRLAAQEFAHGTMLGWVDGAAFAREKWWATLVASAGPILAAVGLWAAMSLAGWLLDRPGALGTIGALLYPCFLIGAIIIAIIAFAQVVGWIMLPAAIACEGTDGIDAIQRVYAYVLGSPLRSIAYRLLGLLVAAIAIAFVWAAGWCISAVAGACLPSVGLDPGPARWLMELWLSLLNLVLLGYAISTLFSTATVVYLVLRRAIDGQDESEIWIPGLVEGTMAPIDEHAGEGQDDDGE